MGLGIFRGLCNPMPACEPVSVPQTSHQPYQAVTVVGGFDPRAQQEALMRQYGGGCQQPSQVYYATATPTPMTDEQKLGFSPTVKPQDYQAKGITVTNEGAMMKITIENTTANRAQPSYVADGGAAFLSHKNSAAFAAPTYATRLIRRSSRGGTGLSTRRMTREQTTLSSTLTQVSQSWASSLMMKGSEI